jgi:hypothetical protein
MPFDCRHRQRLGPQACLEDCLITHAPARFEFVRVERAGDLPPADPRAVDVAILDMHHGWPNLGHAAIVHALQNAVCDLREDLDRAGLVVRALSYDVRRGQMIPRPESHRHALYIGTGGPGHLDPRKNDGVSEGSQGITEDPAWEAPLFHLFDGIRADEHTALFGVCHTFGVMCRWLGIADARLRGPEKGGKSAGITENVLTSEACGHPWFERFSAQLPDRRRLRILDNRLYDLVPLPGADPNVVAVGRECGPGHHGPGEAITMIEVARDAGGVMPRIFAVNHHPEVVNRPRLLTILLQKRDRGEVREDDPWYQERLHALTQPMTDEYGDRLLQLTSSYTFLGPVRFHLYRLVRRRVQALGVPTGVHETRVPIAYGLDNDSQPLAR